VGAITHTQAKLHIVGEIGGVGGEGKPGHYFRPTGERDQTQQSPQEEEKKKKRSINFPLYHGEERAVATWEEKCVFRKSKAMLYGTTLMLRTEKKR